MNPRTSAQDVLRCDLCETAVVQMHCDTCLVNLCKACVGEHMLSDESKKHEVVKFSLRKSTPLYPGCKSHDKERCEMYCNQCDIPVCNSCLASKQHLGHELSKILQVLEKKKYTIIRERIELNDTIYPTYHVIASDVQNRMSQLEKEYEDLSTAITKHGMDCYREIDKLVKKLKAEVDQMKSTQFKTLQKHLDEINKKISNIQDDIKSTEFAIDTYDMSELLSVTSNVHMYRKLPEKLVPSLPKFIPGKILGEIFGTLTSSSLTSDEHGYSMTTIHKSTDAASSPPVKQLLDEPQTIINIRTGYGHPYNVACLSDEEIWASGTGNLMKLFSINELEEPQQLKSIRTKSGNSPSDIAVTKSGDLVYTDYDDRTVNFVNNEKTKNVIRLRNWKPRSVCGTSSGDLLIIMESDDDKQIKVVSYSDFAEKQTIQFDDVGKPLYSTGSYDRFITENRNLDICVSDSGAKAVVVVNQAGKLRFRYTGHSRTTSSNNEPISLRGIITDSQSHILTADYNNDCVHIIDQDGQFLRYIDCVIYPWGLCTDTNDNLFVVQWGSRHVKKIKYLQ
ncbi:uncharacterized protein LOC133202444 [Saccostrea echinata]|uniref:uncharacterized protein LOC133202444 n=1 Tax=Saccostrea echinata TaxID=191078 RepID=UPI002A81A5E4|nr:uncharacterized protein LOC133202444 [Saccostrea echinata]